jgi:hypothetical protein
MFFYMNRAEKTLYSFRHSLQIRCVVSCVNNLVDVKKWRLGSEAGVECGGR